MSIDDDFDRMMITADSMINAHMEIMEEVKENFPRCQTVMEELASDNQSEDFNHQEVRGHAIQQSVLQPVPRLFHGYCGKCRQYGHSRRFCPHRTGNR